MLWSTDPDHNSVHVQMHEQMHVHERCCRDYTFDVCFTRAAPASAPEQAGHASPRTGRDAYRTAHVPLSGDRSARRTGRNGVRPPEGRPPFGGVDPPNRGYDSGTRAPGHVTEIIRYRSA
ncbi:hypothetical protein GCM10010236_54900 [Streptomyces eurythermus]|nr:hypothetical protein GCM10010236_54900 [Streptomyces eurythermus]